MEPRILIIDSMGKKITPEANVVHTRNSLILGKHLDADVIPSSLAGVQSIQDNQYDVVIFVHASAYTDANILVDFLADQPIKQYIYITNEYNLGDPTALCYLCREHFIRYDVISNHGMKASTIRGKRFIDNWHVVNLNALIYDPVELEYPEEPLLFPLEDTRQKLIYYGGFRKNRSKYFQRYFDDRMIVSTSPKNQAKFRGIGCMCRFIPHLDWHKRENSLKQFYTTLYLEDEYTHTHYNHLANRFYEAINLNVPIWFDDSCKGTIERSGIKVDPWWFVRNADELHAKANKMDQWELDHWIPGEWHDHARKEKERTINQILDIIQDAMKGGSTMEQELRRAIAKQKQKIQRLQHTLDIISKLAGGNVEIFKKMAKVIPAPEPELALDDKDPDKPQDKPTDAQKEKADEIANNVHNGGKQEETTPEPEPQEDGGALTEGQKSEILGTGDLPGFQGDVPTIGI